MSRHANVAWAIAGVSTLALLVDVALRVTSKHDSRSSDQHNSFNTFSLSQPGDVNQSRGRLHTLAADSQPRQPRPKQGSRPLPNIGAETPHFPPVPSHNLGNDSEPRQPRPKHGTQPLPRIGTRLPLVPPVTLDILGNASVPRQRGPSHGTRPPSVGAQTSRAPSASLHSLGNDSKPRRPRPKHGTQPLHSTGAQWPVVPPVTLDILGNASEPRQRGPSHGTRPHSVGAQTSRAPSASLHSLGNDSKPRRARPNHGTQPLHSTGAQWPVVPPVTLHTLGNASVPRQRGSKPQLPPLPASLLVLISAYGDSGWRERRTQLKSLVHMCKTSALVLRVMYMSTMSEEVFVKGLLALDPHLASCGPNDPLSIRVMTLPASLRKGMTKHGLQQVIASKEVNADAELMVLYLEDDVRFTLGNLQAYMASLRLIQAAGLLRPGGFIPHFVRCETLAKNVRLLEDPEYAIPSHECIPIDYRFAWRGTRTGILASVRLDSNHPNRFFVPSNAHAALWLAPVWLLNEVFRSRQMSEYPHVWPQVWAATGRLLGDPGGHYRWRTANSSSVLTPVVPCDAANMTVAHLSQKYGGNFDDGLIVDSLQAYIQASCTVVPPAKPKARQCKESNLLHVMDHVITKSRITPLNLVSRAIQPVCTKASDHPFCVGQVSSSSSAVDVLDEYDFVGYKKVCENWMRSDDLSGRMLWSECAARCSKAALRCNAFSFAHDPVHQRRSPMGKCRLWGRKACGKKYVRSHPSYAIFPIVFLYRKRNGSGPAINLRATRAEFALALSQTVCDW